MAGDAAAAAAAGPVGIDFTGRRGFLFRLVLKNAVLTLLTVGIYRFWAKTWMRRFYWSNTRVAGEPLEYLGRPSELFIGFLIALAVVAPLGLVYTFFTTTFIGDPLSALLVDLVYFVVFFFLIQIAIYRMWRYRFTRTAWRGIRCGLDGAAWRFALRWLLWLIPSVLTLGLAYPWMRVSQVRYFWSNARFGQTAFTIEARGLRLLPYWLALLGTWIFVWPLLLVIAGYAAGLSAEVLADIGSVADDQSEMKRQVTALLRDMLSTGRILALLLVPLAFLVIPIAYVWYRVREFRYIAGTIQFAGGGFSSALTTWRIVLLFVATWAILLPVFAAALWVTGIVIAKTGVSPTVSGIVAIIIAMIMAQVILAVIFQYGLYAHACRTLTISDPSAFQNAVQSAEAGPATGEGLADALDVGGF